MGFFFFKNKKNMCFVVDVSKKYATSPAATRGGERVDTHTNTGLGLSGLPSKILNNSVDYIPLHFSINSNYILYIFFQSQASSDILGCSMVTVKIIKNKSNALHFPSQQNLYIVDGNCKVS